VGEAGEVTDTLCDFDPSLPPPRTSLEVPEINALLLVPKV
jgi:hypothetical protein